MERLILWHRLVPTRDEGDDPDHGLSWVRTVQQRARHHRGTVLSTVGSAVVASFELQDLEAAIDLALDLLDESGQQDAALGVCIGIAAGELEEVSRDDRASFVHGSAIDRAQHLSNRARPGEVALDRRARELADRRYLFGRVVGMGMAGLRGETIDRSHPRRRAARRAIRHLSPPPIPPCTEEITAPVVAALRSGGRHRVVLRGPSGAGTREWIDALARELDPPLLLRAEAVPGSLEPLGSLRFALLRRWKTPKGVAAAMKAAALDRKTVEALVAVAEGRALEREPIIRALRSLLAIHADEETPPWVVLDPVDHVDTATVDAVLAATGPGGPDSAVIARLPVDAKAPPALIGDDAFHELVLPAMRHADARVVAEGVLGAGSDAEVVRRVAVIGGETPLGVLEAARTLIASGDIVWNGQGFEWRVSPRGGVKAIEPASLLEERLATLESTPLRVLEAACVAPSGTSNEVLAAVASADGLDDEQLGEAVAQLETEGLIRPESPWQPSSDLLRSVVLQNMQPARQGELDRFVAEAMAATALPNAEFGKATLGWYLAEGGHEREGARALIEAGRAAQLSGFTRAALRLAAAAVQFDRSDQTRVAAATLTRAARRPRTPPKSSELERTPPPPDTVVAPADDGATRDIAAQVVAGILERDFEAADRFLDIAIAEGHDRAAAERVRALATLARGDLAAAMSHLAQSRAMARDERAEARGELAHALLLLYAGDVHSAVRAGLASLSKSRSRRDPRGEAAALHTLALCYRSLSRADDAARLEDASPA